MRQTFFYGFRKNTKDVAASFFSAGNPRAASPRLFLPALVLLTALIFPGKLPAASIEPSSLSLPEDISVRQEIRVAVVTGKREIQVSCPSKYRLEMLQSKSLISEGKNLPTVKIIPAPGGIRFGNDLLSLDAFRISTFNSPVRIGDRSYSGGILIFKEKTSRLVAVQAVNLEEYLNGVLPHEMLSKWPLEALKAQAIASRTYALFKELLNQKSDYSLSGDVLGQMYGGSASFTEATKLAVMLTRGEILTYKGKIFPAYFHSTCGGKTTHAEYIWPIKPHHCLKGVDCVYCMASNHFRWESAVTEDEVKGALKRSGRIVGEIRVIAPQDVDESGRAKRIQVRHSKGDVFIQANDFRLALGSKVLKSLKDLRVTPKGKGFVFKGTGWGHGVGLCQWGAKTLAERGKSCEEILAFYYPGSEITRIRD